MDGDFMIKSKENSSDKNQVALYAELQEIFKPVFELDPEKIQVFVHGSWADNTRTAFSDLDDLIIVDDDYLPIAKPALDAIELTFQKIDPLQHHGHWLVKRSQLRNYDESYMPLHIMKNAVSLYGSIEIRANVNPGKSKKGTIRNCMVTLKNIEDLSKEFFQDNLNVYLLKCFVGSIALMPPMLFQIQEIFIDKRSAILEADKLFTKESLELLQWASDLRNHWDKLLKDPKYLSLLEDLSSNLTAQDFRNYIRLNAPVLDYGSLSKIKITDSHIKGFIDESVRIVDGVCFKKMHKEAYDSAYEKIEAFAKVEKAILVGQFGMTKHPGISDMDVFICFEDKHYREGCERVINFIENDNELNYLFTHNPMFVSKSNLSILSDLHTLQGLSISWNPEKLNLGKLDVEKEDFIHWVWSYHVFKVARNYLQKDLNFIDCRQLLMVLKMIQKSTEFVSFKFCNKKISSLFGSDLLRDEILKNGINRNKIEIEFKKAVNLFYNVILEGGRNMKPLYKRLYVGHKSVLISSAQFEDWNRREIQYGVTTEYIPVLFFNLLTKYLFGLGKQERDFMNSSRQMVLNHKITGGTLNTFLLLFDKNISMIYPSSHRTNQRKMNLKRNIKRIAVGIGLK